MRHRSIKNWEWERLNSKCWQRKIPARRLGKPSEAAEAVVYLASAESGFTVGSELVIACNRNQVGEISSGDSCDANLASNLRTVPPLPTSGNLSPRQCTFLHSSNPKPVTTMIKQPKLLISHGVVLGQCFGEWPLSCIPHDTVVDFLEGSCFSQVPPIGQVELFTQ